MIEAITSFSLETVVIILLLSLGSIYAVWNAVVRVQDRYFPTERSLSHRVSLLETDAEENRSFRRNMMRETIRSQHRDYMAQGYISEEDLEHFELTYNVYKDNGGNGTALRWCKEVQGLPRERINTTHD